MERRTFLIRSSQLGVSAAVSSVLLGCGGNTEDAIVQSAKLSDIDLGITEMNKEQDKLAFLHLQIQDNLGILDRLPQFGVDTPVSEHYLSGTDLTLWENAKHAHQIGYEQYLHQFSKLQASFRLYDHHAVSSKSTSSKITLGVKASAQKTVSELEDETLSLLISMIEGLSSEGLGGVVLDSLEWALMKVYEQLKELLSNSEEQTALAYAFLAYAAIDELLDIIQEKSLSATEDASSNEIISGLAKVTIAGVAILALIAFETLQEAREESSDTQDVMIKYITAQNVESKAASVWMAVTQKVSLDTADTLQQNLKKSIETGSIGDTSELSSTLKEKSQMLAITSVILQQLFTKSSQTGVASTQSGFTPGSTADNFKVLFGSDKNPYDEVLSQKVYENTAAFSAYSPDLSILAQTSTFKVSVSPEARTETIEAENSAYSFAKELASVSYSFTESTESDAVEFATHLADLAYAFVMDIEEDAYQFALQGMEYGYLFASRGEEVGVMADRILWMAVQIGVMADRIGEMADRIVYTEQLIVYTEILILDFGLLIYGFGSFITNIILSGMALILDREWYSYESDTMILEMINSNVKQMLENMHTYSLQVLEHQNELRDSTLEALDILPFAEQI